MAGPGHPGRAQGALQDGVGGQAAQAGGHGGGPGGLHRPVSELQRAHVRSQLWEAHLPALPCLEGQPRHQHIHDPFFVRRSNVFEEERLAACCCKCESENNGWLNLENSSVEASWLSLKICTPLFARLYPCSCGFQDLQRNALTFHSNTNQRHLV